MEREGTTFTQRNDKLHKVLYGLQDSCYMKEITDLEQTVTGSLDLFQLHVLK